ncbi:helix-turn-helix transcriptional regulator [Cellulomonas marina]|uniref:Helix-turn-helix domain-containing protein n=1 Tax=Cellulomonas marina TaxID=988821 RepID=A0A1I0Y4P9_9CELL|nr:helix-turn-helix transcriptional regulator [Cellulomonas marina]GIG29796.1 transcriptional regulator [Cellulomonas marina]SFB08271.1 Helix-turn-helix domain-containing protein [Cellulomonas marina]
MTDTVTETLGTALRRWRDRLDPADVGLPAGRRRARGLRREELAQLAGLSVDYVVRLEQGRASHPSAQVMGALARALQLSDDERDHLHVLAGLLPPRPTTVSTHLPPGIVRLVHRLTELPLAVFSASWDLVTWTPLWAALLGDPGALPEGERNLVRTWFLGTGPLAVRSSVGEPGSDPDVEHIAAFEAALVADLRVAAGRYPDDRALRALVAELHAGSPRFARLWDSGATGEHQSASKTVHHPVVGPIALDCDVLTVPGSDLKVVVHSAPASSSAAQALELLRVTGGLPVRAATGV